MRDAKNEITINRIALILSGIFPGIGQIYKREYLKGLDLIIIYCMSIFFLFYPARILFPLGVVLVPTLWVWSVVDAGTLFTSRSRRQRYSQLRRKMILVVGGMWVSAVIIFAITATTIKYKLTTSESAVIADEELKSNLLAEEAPIATSDDTPSNSTNASSTIPVEAPQDSNPAKLATTSSDMPSPLTDTQTVSVESEPGQLQQIDVPILEKKPISYVVTVGVFSQYQNAERQRILLSQKKYQALIVPTISSGNLQVYAVVVSGFSSISDAQAIANKLKKEIGEYRDCFVATLDKPTVRAERVR